MLNPKLFHEGQKPAVNVGTSVSRVGGKTQARVLRNVADTLRLDYAQFLEMAEADLIEALTADYMHAQLCRAGLHAFAAENEARMEAMEAARCQVERQLASLLAMQRAVRQEEITEEVIELAAGETASRGRA